MNYGITVHGEKKGVGLYIECPTCNNQVRVPRQKTSLLGPFFKWKFAENVWCPYCSDRGLGDKFVAGTISREELQLYLSSPTLIPVGNTPELSSKYLYVIELFGPLGMIPTWNVPRMMKHIERDRYDGSYHYLAILRNGIEIHDGMILRKREVPNGKKYRYVGDDFVSVVTNIDWKGNVTSRLEEWQDD